MDIDVEDEDSLSERLTGNKTVEAVDIAVIRLPRIATLRTLTVLESLPGVSVRYIRRGGGAGPPGYDPAAGNQEHHA